MNKTRNAHYERQGFQSDQDKIYIKGFLDGTQLELLVSFYSTIFVKRDIK